MKPFKQFNINAGLMKPLQIIVAVDEDGGFGKDGKIPWNHPEDLKRFQAITKNSACIMGRKTYQDILDMVVTRKAKTKNKQILTKEILPSRDSYIVSNTIKEAIGATVVKKLRQAVNSTNRNRVFIIGGEKLFIEALPWVEKVYLTVVKGQYACDRFFPVDYLANNFLIWEGKQANDSLLFIEYIRK